MGVTDQLYTPLRAATMKTLAGVLAVTGMRISEVLQLRVGDLDLDHGVVLIANAKFGRQRLVQLHPSSCRAVAGYLRLPVRHRLGVAPERPVFVTSKGSAVHERTAHQALHQMIKHAGLARRAGARPRPHDLRHTFAVHTLIDWQREGADIPALLPVLSTYLGHVEPANTYWYLSATPKLMHLAAARLEQHFGGRP